jgi:NTP pyrophosphatase (non-canonical NTP hydrolase)
MAIKVGEETAEVVDAFTFTQALTSQAGKVMEAVIKTSQHHSKPVNLGAELADLMIVTLVLAEYANLDLQKELDKKISLLPDFNWLDAFTGSS